MAVNWNNVLKNVTQTAQRVNDYARNLQQQQPVQQQQQQSFDPNARKWYDQLLQSKQVASSSTDQNVLNESYRKSNEARNALTGLGIDTSSGAWAKGTSYDEALQEYNRMFAQQSQPQQQENQFRQESSLIEDISSKYGFDYSRDYARSQAEALAQAKRDEVAQGRKAVESNVMGSAEALDRDYFQRYMQQAQAQTNAGLNAGIVADQDLRLAMARQAQMGDVYRDANLRNYELDNLAGRIEQERIAYEDQLYNERLQQAFQNIQADRNFRLQEGELTGRYLPEGVDQQEVSALIDELVGYMRNSANDLSPYERALNHARANAVRNRLASMGADVSLLARGTTPDEVYASLGNLFSTAPIREGALNRNQQASQWEQQFAWEQERYSRELEQRNREFEAQLELSYDQLDQDMKQFLQSMEWDKHRWNNMSAEQKEGFSLAREQLAEEKRQFNSEQAWREYTYNNMSATDKRRFDQEIELFGDELAWRNYELEKTFAFQAGFAGNDAGGANVNPNEARVGQLGSLSHKYESGGDPGAIGHDSTGGWSYGTYQIASNTGTMASFMDFMKNNNEYKPFYNPLSAHPVGSGSFNKTWQQLAENPTFAKAQQDFIKYTHYDPAHNAIRKELGITIDTYPNAVRDVLWSTAVQHGSAGATRVFKNAGIKKGMKPEEIINRIYDERMANNGMKYFPSSTQQVRNSVVNRFKKEKQDALNMLT